MNNRTSQASQGDSPTDPIASLAAHAGIVGGRRGSVARLLSAMGFDVSSTRVARATWRGVAQREAERWLGPVRVLRTGERALVLPVTPDSAGRYEIDIRLESGENLLRRGRVRAVPGGIEVRLPAQVPAGTSGGAAQRGNPSPRCAIRLRWISLVPMLITHISEWRSCCSKRPLSSAPGAPCDKAARAPRSSSAAWP